MINKIIQGLKELFPNLLIIWKYNEIPLQVPCLMVDLPEELLYEIDGNNVLHARTQLLLYVITDAPLENEANVQNQCLENHENLVNHIISNLFGKTIKSNDLIIANLYAPLSIQTIKQNENLIYSIIKYDIELYNYCINKHYSNILTTPQIYVNKL